MEVQGFTGAAVEAGIRYTGRLDLGVIYSKTSCVTAATFTRNLVKAAPVLDSMALMEKSREFKAIVVNSGNANACTGKQGLQDCVAIREKAAGLLGCHEDEVLVASTGVIGAFLPMDKYLAGLEKACAKLSPEGLLQVSEAILTTDTRVKVAMREVENKGKTINIFGMAKGAGMIAPDMGPPHATMLAFIMTDAVVEPDFWQQTLQDGVDGSFNRITVDGDTSTNDTVLALANGMARNQVADGYGELSQQLADALGEVLQSLAQQIVMDGEGATKCVTVRIKGAQSFEDAKRCAQTICNSPLVKTAFFGEDPNWGRIIAAAGRSGANFAPDAVAIAIGGVKVVEKGLPIGEEAEKMASEQMKKHRFEVEVDLNSGDFDYSMLTCDLTREYVDINADYRT
ncbi:MAG: bifunctional glutamate N-acetyltransferase/amino-acid acetyltransferase ArgJ [Thermodesulfobacteria bacterium]|nr:bifunctional glutamate N-acetyltransferase/amino-acid acetyltransferase ArgJ [Thermodesulfobacteriota bacterium]